MTEIVAVDGYRSTGKTTLVNLLASSLTSDNFNVLIFEPPDYLYLEEPNLSYWDPLLADIREYDYVILDTSWLTEEFIRVTNGLDTTRHRELVDLYDQLMISGVTRLTYMLLSRPWKDQIPCHREMSRDIANTFWELQEYNNFVGSSDFSKLAYKVYPDFTRLVLVENKGTVEELLGCREAVIF